MRVILRHPDTGRDVAVDDHHVDYWEGQGYRVLGKKPKKAAKSSKSAAKKAAAKTSDG